jgi:hypothetical protein
MQNAVEEVIARIVRAGLDDWVPVDVLLWYARRASPDPVDSFKEVAITALRILLNEELATVGDIGETGFERWKGTVGESVDRIIAECEAMNWEPLGSLCWLSSTPNGDQLAAHSQWADELRD